MTDEELVARLKSNDDEAYREVVARFGDALYAYLHHLTGDHHLSEDVLGETYLRMVERIDSYTYYGAPFKAWLYRIAHNLAINTLRQRQRLVQDVPEQISSDDDPAARVSARLEAEELRQAIGQLTDEQQQVVLLRFVADQPSSEVARVMEKTENAVKQLQWRALRSLGRLLNRRGQD